MSSRSERRFVISTLFEIALHTFHFRSTKWPSYQTRSQALLNSFLLLNRSLGSHFLTTEQKAHCAGQSTFEGDAFEGIWLMLFQRLKGTNLDGCFLPYLQRLPSL